LLTSNDVNVNVHFNTRLPDTALRLYVRRCWPLCNAWDCYANLP